MNWLQAFILGLLQGLTEFLPVSSSGHLELGKALLGVEAEESLIFTLVVHGATVLSTIVVFRNDIGKLFAGLFQFKWNEETIYITKLLLSTIPVVILGLFFRDEIAALFAGNILLVASMLLFTSVLLAFTYFAKEKEKKISYFDSIIIGLAQAIAVMPGISRSGSTIASGLLLNNKKSEVSKFSFLMVLIPIIGANVLDIFSGGISQNEEISASVLLIGFATAFVSGLFACKWMIALVNKGKLIYFALYCAIVGIAAIVAETMLL